MHPRRRESVISDHQIYHNFLWHSQFRSTEHSDAALQNFCKVLHGMTEETSVATAIIILPITLVPEELTKHTTTEILCKT
jgi:hypothetical protein